MPHVEVPRLLANADKIGSQLNLVLSEKPQIYSKTRERYKELAISLLSSVEKIASILEADSLAGIDNKTSEFGTCNADVSDLSEAVIDAKNKIDSYTSFVSSSDTPLTNVNRETLKRYGQVLEQASNHNFRCVEASECAYILNKWFKSRFSNNKGEFKYNIAYLPEWITNIIILYGKYHSNDDSIGFVNMMTTWCDDLVKKPSKWAVPYEVHQLSKCSDPSSYTIDAVVIGDILMDEILYQLTDSNSPDIVSNLECYPVASRVKLRNPSLLPIIRTRLAKQDSLLSKYNLTISERRA